MLIVRGCFTLSFIFFATLLIKVGTYIVKGDKDVNEKELVLKAKNGDIDAFCSLYSEIKEKLYRYAYYKLGNSHDAQDAVSDCVVSAFEQISNLRKPEYFNSWIFKILSNKCSYYIKHQIFQKENKNIDEVKTLQVEDKHYSEVYEALEKLNSAERELVLLSVVAGFNSKEIAKVIGLTPGGVRSKISRSLKKMREFLE